MRTGSRLARWRRYAIGGLIGATVTSTLGATPAFAAGKPDLIITGSVASAAASFETEGRHMDGKSLSGVRSLGGAQVALMWFPADIRDEAAQGAAKTAARPLKVVGSTVADSAGRFSIGSRPTAEMVAAAKENDGWINFLMATSHGGDYVLEGISRHWDGAKWTSYGDERPGMSPRDARKVVFATDAKTGERKYGSNPKMAAKSAQSSATLASSLAYCG